MTGTIEWIGTAWRLWNVGGLLPAPRLINPWETSGMTYTWQPGTVQTARCFWMKPMRSSGFVFYADSPEWARDLGLVCQGLVAEACTCGIRSMMTLANLAAFWGAHPDVPHRASVVGRIRYGGKVQHRIPDLKVREGYTRSEYAELVGPLFVSPFGGAGWRAGRLASEYAPIELFGPEHIVDAADTHDWLEKLAERVEPTLCNGKRI